MLDYYCILNMLSSQNKDIIIIIIIITIQDVNILCTNSIMQPMLIKYND